MIYFCPGLSQAVLVSLEVSFVLAGQLCFWTSTGVRGDRATSLSFYARPAWAFSSAESAVHEKDLQSLGLELSHHPFHQTLLTKSSHKTSPNSRHGETDSTISWEDLRTHIAKGIDRSEANDWGHQYIWSTSRYHPQIDKKCSYNTVIESGTTRHWKRLILLTVQSFSEAMER